MAEIVVPAVASVVTPLFVEFLKKKVNERNMSLADIHDAINKGLERLLALQKDKETKVSSNYLQKDPSNLAWKQRVSKIEGVVTPLNKEYEEVKEKKREAATWWTNPRTPVKKKIKKALKEVIELLEIFPGNVLVDKQPERVIMETGVPPTANYPTLDLILYGDVKPLQEH